MAYNIFKKGSVFYIVDGTRIYNGLSKNVKVKRYTTAGTDFYIDGVDEWNSQTIIPIADILDEVGVAYTLSHFVRFAEGIGAVDVSVQDSTSPLVILKATQLIAETTLSTLAVQDAYTFTVTSPTGGVIGQQLSVYSPINNRVSFFEILNIVGSVLTVDTPIDFAYEVGASVQFGNTNLAVNGSVTPIVFGVRNTTTQDIELSADFTRMIITMQTTSLGNYSQFGNITRLTKGLVCRKVNGEKRNIFNVKDNRQLKNLMFDFDLISASGIAPDAVRGRFTFKKLGSVIRLRPFEDLQFIVQDNLTAITKFQILVEGAGVVD